MSKLKRLLLPIKPKDGFSFILIDPPWENRSVDRSNKYMTLPNFKLFSLPVERLCGKCGSLVAVWVTNRPRFQNFVKTDLFKKWKVKYLTTWYWLKVTNEGEMVIDLKSKHRKPYEKILFGIFEEGSFDFQLPENNVICSIPGSHSRKPPLLGILVLLFFFFHYSLDVIKPYLPPENTNYLELFARNLTPRMTSWGNEVLHFQQRSYFTKENNLNSNEKI